MKVEEFKQLKVGNSLKIKISGGEINCIVTGQPYYNSDCEEKGWEVETNNGVISIDNDIKLNHIYIKTDIDLFDAVSFAYMQGDTELTEEFLEGILIQMKKKDLVNAWNLLQSNLNDNTVVRLNRENLKEEDRLIPNGWGEEIIVGDAKELLNQINEEKYHGGEVFARSYHNYYLDFIYGQFDFKFKEQSEQQKEENDIER